MKIYLSPANHHKLYANGETEKRQMEKVAARIKELLESEYEDVCAYLPTVFAKNQQYDGRPQEASLLHIDYYVALHTNASGVSATGGKATGACGFYHPSYTASKKLATVLVEKLNAICPIKSNRAAKPAIYAQGKHVNFGELREPAQLGICPVLIEHEFHDRQDGADWIVNNTEAIAQADVAAIAVALGLKKRPMLGDVNGDGDVNTLDVAAILRHDAGIGELTDEQLAAADVNGDGVVSTADAVAILKGEVSND